MTATAYDIKDPSLAEAGTNRIEWALTEMPVLRTLMTRFGASKPLDGVRIAPACTSPPRPPTSPGCWWPAAPNWRCAPAIRSPPRTTSPPLCR